MKRLRLIYSEKRSARPPRVSYEYLVSSKSLAIKWIVEGSPIFADPHRPKNRPSFGLWMMDVVEFFGRVKGGKSYYEFQVSPHGQFFELKIEKPLAKIDLAYRGRARYSASISRSKKSWSASMVIPLKSLGIKTGDKYKQIEGNFFAILGRPFGRFYFSAFMPKTREMPNFHNPFFFREL